MLTCHIQADDLEHCGPRIPIHGVPNGGNDCALPHQAATDAYLETDRHH
jgi:hypothetical protein